MKIIILFLSFLTLTASAQFGFERIDTVEVIKNSISQKYPWAGGIDYAQFSNIDLNYDGVEDLFIFDRTCFKVLTFIQNGATGVVDYEYAPEYESLFPTMQNWSLLADYDCDGDKDIYTHTIGGVKVYKNTGSAGAGLSFDLEKSILRTNIYGSSVYMYVSSVDIPAITDVDGDGDIDILAFGVGGVSVEYQRNMSVENYGTCDSLEFVTGSICWGLFKESASSNAIELNQSCSGQVANPYSETTQDNQDRHAGSTVLVLDMDANGVMDLVLGDISYNTLTMLTNGGTTVNSNSAMSAQDNAFPSNSTAVNLPIYPAAYHVDVDNDGVRDLLVSPASTIGAENQESVWYYSNSGADNLPTFNHQSNDFLQGEMIDYGSGSYPVYFDHNGDGLKDLLISVQGKYNSISTNQESKIAYYENTGTLLSPEYTFITDDYQNISVLGISTKLNFYPTFGDLDGDGDEDMILGEYSGYSYFFENTGGAGNNAIFNVYTILKDADDALIIDGVYPIPQLVDLDRDGDLDLVLGKRNGKLNYYKNTGSATNYSFELITNELGGVNVAEEGFIEGRAVPVFVDIENEYHLIVGSKSGFLHYYGGIDNNLESNFTLIDSDLEGINIGTQSAPAIFDITEDDKLEMILGNKRGGLAMYKSAFVTEVGLKSAIKELEFSIYPNPATNLLTVTLPEIGFKQNETITLKVMDVSGRIVLNQTISSPTTNLNIESLKKGIYLVVLEKNGVNYTDKLIIK